MMGGLFRSDFSSTAPFGAACFEMVLRLAAMEGVEYDFPDVRPCGWPSLSTQ
jgi:hypothetical protein